MIYSATTPAEEVPYYCLPEIGGYFMSKTEQHAIYSRLKARRGEISNEIASLEGAMKEAGVRFASLSRSLSGCQIGNLDWSPYQNLVTELPRTAARYDAAKSELADIQAQLSKFTFD
jgi:hypothetical protein